MAKLKEVGTFPRRVQVRSCKYLNNVVEQDHRRIKQRIRPMLGFKRFETAAVTIRGIELAAKIKKQQFDLKFLTGNATTAPENLGRGTGRLKSAKPLAPTKNIHLSKFAPEPFADHVNRLVTGEAVRQAPQNERKC